MDKHEKPPNVLEWKSEYKDNGELAEMYQRVKMPLMSEREIVLKFDMRHIQEGEHAGKSLWVMKTF